MSATVRSPAAKNGRGSFDLLRERLRRNIDRAAATFHKDDSLFDFVKNYPRYAWVKEYRFGQRSFIMRAFSRRFAVDFIGPKHMDYIGVTDFDFWPSEIASQIYRSDERLLSATRTARGEDHSEFEFDLRSPTTGFQATLAGEVWSYESGGIVYIAGRGDIRDEP